MRRLHALLIAAGLAAAPSRALADEPSTHTFEWSMTSSKGRLGLLVIGLTPELRTHYGAPPDRGVLVGRVDPSSAASAAGITVGDILVEVRGQPVDDGADVLAALAGAKKGDAVPIGVLRGKQRVSLTAKLTDDATPTPLGATSRDLDFWKKAFPPFDWMFDWMRDAQRSTATRTPSGKPLDTTRS